MRRDLLQLLLVFWVGFLAGSVLKFLRDQNTNPNIAQPQADVLYTSHVNASASKSADTEIHRFPDKPQKNTTTRCYNVQGRPGCMSSTISVGIFSMASNVGKDRRRAIRNTWLSDYTDGRAVPYTNPENMQPCKVAARFIIGTSQVSVSDMEQLQKEQEEFGDLAFLEDANDQYGIHMNVKLLSWVAHTFTYDDAQFFLKASDDAYVNVTRLCKAYMHDMPKTRRIYYGLPVHGSQVLRVAHKNSDDAYDVCSDTYHPYMTGFGWGFSAEIAKYLSDNRWHLRKFVNDDVTFGLWMQAIDVVWVADSRVWHHLGLVPGALISNNWPIALTQNPGLFQRACCEGIISHLHSGHGKATATNLLHLMHATCVNMECWDTQTLPEKVSERHFNLKMNREKETNFRAVAVMKSKKVAVGDEIICKYVTPDIDRCVYSKGGFEARIHIRDIYKPDKYILNVDSGN